MKENDPIEKKLSLPQGLPMKAPEGYFDSFSARLQDRISQEHRREVPTGKTLSQALRLRLIPVLTGALALAAVLIMGVKWLSAPQELLIPQAQVSELIEYSGYNFDESQLLDMLEPSTTEGANTTEGAEILDYLSTQDMDLTDVSVEL